MGARFRRFGGRNKGNLRPDRKSIRQGEALDRQDRYEHEKDAGLVTKKGDSLHFNK